jgi:hypothetical protein
MVIAWLPDAVDRVSVPCPTVASGLARYTEASDCDCASWRTSTCAERLLMSAPAMAEAVSKLESETLGWVNSEPPAISFERAVANPSMAPEASASAEIRAVFAVSRRAINASFGAFSAAARSSINALVSMPAPAPRLNPIDVTMTFPSGGY